ncbi:hypothetical protein niasHS_014334 [Heterodera schachtii]|uniref:Uncharacterized protein n=2 Tax=Heterodera TaxID=34509 RepID=A0ABD2I466_HETSC
MHWAKGNRTNNTTHQQEEEQDKALCRAIAIVSAFFAYQIERTTTADRQLKKKRQNLMADYDYLMKFLALGDSGVGKPSFLTPDIILCGNKSDLENRRQFSTACAKQLADSCGCPTLRRPLAPPQTSVEKSVDCLLDLVMQRIQMSVDGDNFYGIYGRWGAELRWMRRPQIGQPALHIIAQIAEQRID